MSRESRCLLLTLLVLLASSKHGLASPGDSNPSWTDDSDASNPSATPFTMADITEETEGPSNEPRTFVYFDEVPGCIPVVLSDGSGRCSVWTLLATVVSNAGLNGNGMPGDWKEDWELLS